MAGNNIFKVTLLPSWEKNTHYFEEVWDLKSPPPSNDFSSSPFSILPISCYNTFPSVKRFMHLRTLVFF